MLILPLLPIVIASAATAHRLGPLALGGGLVITFVGVGLFVATIGFGIGLFGVITRRNTVGILLGIELMLNAVNINLIAFGAYWGTPAGQVFALFVITIAAAEVGVGLAIVLLLFRNFRSPDLDEVHQLKG